MSETRGSLLKIRIGFLLAGLSLAAGSYFVYSSSPDSTHSKKSTLSRDHLPASVEESASPTPTAVDNTEKEISTTAITSASSQTTSSTSDFVSEIKTKTSVETKVSSEASTQKEILAPAPAEKIPETLKVQNNDTSLILPQIDFWAWVGIGVNYTSSSQSVEGFSELEFGRIKGPSTMLRAGFYVTDHAGLELGFKNTPGEAKSSESITVNDGDYNWLTMSAEALYRPTAAAKHSEWTWRLGLQQHQMPFLFAEGVNEVSMVDTSMTNLSLGFEYKKQLKKRLRFEWLMRYQYPVATSNTEAMNFKVSPNVGFDGSIGTAYQLSENTFIGVYWYGQYHDFDFKYQAPSTAEVSGRQSLFFTNFDLRLGMEF